MSAIDHVVIVGGGTAGWLSAGILAKQLNTANGGVKVTVIESPDIPIIGVGEGTWPTLRGTLQRLGISESEFMRECDVTFKQGSEFVDWRVPPTDGKHESYYHPLSAVFHAAYDFNLAPYWLLGHAGENVGYDLAVATQSRLCQMGIAPKLITTPEYAAVQNYAYHLNANKFAPFLTKFCTETLGVNHVSANVVGVNTDDEGFVTSLETDRTEAIEADFFVDCSGSRALVIEGALGVKWKGIDHILFNDTAMAMQVPYPDDATPVKTHTISTAHDAGWTWDIGLPNRRGTGYVYSSAHTTDEEAERTLRNYAGDMAKDIDVRKIPLRLGYREKFWHKNCVAIGMSAAFIEPLEASAIFLVDAAANMLADQFPRARDELELIEKKYNTTFSLRWDKSVDFVKLHYCLSQRRDTAYWVLNTDLSSAPDSLMERLEHWKSHVPSKYDFDYAYEPFVLDSYLYVLYGMGFKTNIDNKAEMYADVGRARKAFSEIEKLTTAMAEQLPAQRELCEKVYKYGMSKV
jgi:flavin-dependent dehydrogenase